MMVIIMICLISHFTSYIFSLAQQDLELYFTNHQKILKRKKKNPPKEIIGLQLCKYVCELR